MILLSSKFENLSMEASVCSSLSLIADGRQMTANRAKSSSVDTVLTARCAPPGESRNVNIVYQTIGNESF